MKKTASINVKIPTESENYPSLTAPSCKEVHGLYGIQELHARPPIRLPACPAFDGAFDGAPDGN